MAATLKLHFSSREFGDLPDASELDRLMRNAIEEATEIGEQLTQSLTPKRRPYTFSTVRSVVLGAGSRAEGHFGSDDRIFGFLELGTDRHPITPTEKKALWWVGALHPMKRVNHPGTRPYSMLENSANAASGVAKMKLREAMEEALS